MPRAASCLLLALTLVLAPAPAPFLAAAQEPQKPGSQSVQKCTKCRSQGRLPCAEHTLEECKSEALVQYCSMIDGCASCGGLGWLDCAACVDAPVEKALAERKLEFERGRARLAPFEEFMGRELRMVEDPNFVVIWELDELKVGKQRLGAHALAHLYLARMQAVRGAYMEALRADPLDFKVKNQMMFWGLVADHHRAAAKWCEMTGDGSMKLMGAVANFTVCAARKYFPDDRALHRHVAHNLSHLLLSHQAPSNWLGRIGAGWADEGLAHWMEDRVLQECGTYCYEEVNTSQQPRPGPWKPAWRKLVAKGEAPGLPSMLTLNTDQLSPEQHMAAFSAVDYLLQLDGARANQLFKLLRQRKPPREALAEIYKMNPLELQAAWHAWVLETYPLVK
ncbi:MAG: hypothetical protein FJ299_15650 [Planctomycetes bacterium]|nr:hypothetical protein [Planctomycetota bacterium]